MALTKISLILLLSLVAFYSKTVKSQNCSCAPNFCCSQFGYCGTTADYCGSTCRSGPCRGGGPPTGAGLVGSIVTQSFFNNIINLAGNGCAGKRFYTRDSFINATNTFPNFANTVTRREIATMFAHFTFDTGRKNLFLGFMLFFFIHQACSRVLGYIYFGQDITHISRLWHKKWVWSIHLKKDWTFDFISFVRLFLN